MHEAQAHTGPTAVSPQAFCGFYLVQAHDPEPAALPERRDRAPDSADAEAGRGLWIIDALAPGWTVEPGVRVTAGPLQPSLVLPKPSVRGAGACGPCRWGPVPSHPEHKLITSHYLSRRWLLTGRAMARLELVQVGRAAARPFEVIEQR